MQAAAGVIGMFRFAAQDCLDRPDRAAGDRRRGLVHSGEGRIVAGADARFGLQVGIGGEAPNRREISG